MHRLAACPRRSLVVAASVMSHVQALYERRNAAAGRPQAGDTSRLASAGHGTPGASPRKYVSMASTNRVVPPGLRTPSTASRARLAELGVSSEPIRAYLRIRPPGAADAPAAPYVHPVSDTEVVMTPPAARSEMRARLNMVSAPTKYKFSRVFDGASEAAMGKPAAQCAFFEQTTLPLVKDLLDGKNSLVFTYGVTNSGKTYTVQGGEQSGEAGILPRAIDVVFNSTRGLECRRAIRPVGLSGVQPGISDPCTSLLREPAGSGAGRRAPAPMRPALTQDDEVDPTKVEVDDHYRYSIWVSYVEVYNERLYDLLNGHSLPTSDAHASASARRPLVLKSEVESGGKYVGGLKEVKVNSIQEAKGLLRRGQENRAVYGTMANHISSRSHSVFTIKVIREHVDVQLDERDVAGLSRKYFISRMSIVDLAGSERIANTDITAGPRLKEAGNINMSLMCLGQCLETMRKNQIRAGIYAENAESEGAAPETVRKHTRRQSVIPFRHSKLTGLFQSFFTGDGKVVMIVNVNPYATGYEENSNVMRFSAMAKDVGIHVNPRAPTELSVAELSDGDIGSQSTTRTRRGVPGQFSDTDAFSDGDASEAGEASEDAEEHDEFVRMLVEENERLRLRVRLALRSARLTGRRSGQRASAR